MFLYCSLFIYLFLMCHIFLIFFMLGICDQILDIVTFIFFFARYFCFPIF